MHFQMPQLLFAMALATARSYGYLLTRESRLGHVESPLNVR